MLNNFFSKGIPSPEEFENMIDKLSESDKKLKNDKGKTALICFCENIPDNINPNKYIDGFKKLCSILNISLQKYVSMIDFTGKDAFMHYISNDHLTYDFTDFLFKNSSRHKDDSGKNGLMYFLTKERTDEYIKEFINKYYRLSNETLRNMEDNYGRDLYMYYIQYQKGNDTQLRKKFKDPDGHIDNSGKDYLWYDRKYRDIPIIKDYRGDNYKKYFEKLDTSDIYSDYLYDIYAKNKNNDTSIYMYICKYNKNIYYNLLNGPGWLCSQRGRIDYDGKTALMYYCINSPEIYKDIIKFFECEINVADDYGKTALMYLCERGYQLNKQIMSLLKEVLFARDNNGKTALIYSIESGNFKKNFEFLKEESDITDNDGNGIDWYISHSMPELEVVY